MKKTKRLAALFLALMMSLSLLAVTASAYGVEEHTHDAECCDAVIMRKPATPYCWKCGALMGIIYQELGVDGNVTIYQCQSCDNLDTITINW